MMENNSLQHWGIRGMRWGIRRYQNKDGTLTKAGKKRYDKEMEKLKAEEKVLKNKQRTQAKIDKLEAKRKELDDMKNPKKGTSADTDNEPAKTKTNDQPKNKGQLTNEELQARIDRLTLEARVKDLELKLNPPPPEAKKGESFISKFGPKLAEIGLDVGKQYLSKEIEKRFQVEDPLGKLKAKEKELGIRKSIAESEMKIRQNEEQKQKMNEERERKKAEKEAEKQAKKEAKKEAVNEPDHDDVSDEDTGWGSNKKNTSIVSTSNRPNDNIHWDMEAEIRDVTNRGPKHYTEYESYSSYNESYSSPSNSKYSSAGQSAVTDLLSNPSISGYLPASRDDD